MKNTLPVGLLHLAFGTALLLSPQSIWARDRVSVGIQITSGPAWGTPARGRTFGPTCGSPWNPPHCRYPGPSAFCPPPVLLAPRRSVVYYSSAYPAYPVYSYPTTPVYAAPAPTVGYMPYPLPAPPPSTVIFQTPANASVLRVQTALRQRKYYAGSIDGLSGPETRAAIRAYQVDRGLPVTGQIDADLLNDLGQ